MNLQIVKQVSTMKYHRTLYWIQKNSPELLMVGGIGGISLSTYLMCKATTKMEGVILNTSMAFNAIDKGKEKGHYNTEEDYIRDKALVALDALRYALRYYGPAFVLYLISIGFLVGSNRILNTRNTGLMAAYAVVDQAYKKYRGRVIDEFGEDVDNYIRFKKPYEGELNIVNEKKKPVNFEEVDNVDLPGEIIETVGYPLSPYARVFDSDHPQYRQTPIENEYYLKLCEKFVNEKLEIRGHMLLNDVYDEIGLSRTADGCVVGWMHDPKFGGNGFIDFDLYNDYNSAFHNGYDGGKVVLDFNVDGPIYRNI